MISNRLPRWFLAGLLLATPLLVSACNTMEGMGRDIGAAGNAITGTAQDTKEDLKK